MGIKTKAEIAATFQQGDKPTEAQFADWIDTMFAQPSGATYPAIIEAESTASSTSRPVGAVGLQLLSTVGTASAVGVLGVPDSFSTVGKALASAASTAAAQAVLGGGTAGIGLFEASTTAAAYSLLGIPDSITGQIESPASGNYVLDQYAAFPYTIEYLARQAVSGHTDLTLQIDGTNVTGIVSAATDQSEAISSAAGANTVVVGNTVRLRATGVSSASKLSFTVKIVRT